VNDLPGQGRRILVIDNYDSFVFNLVQYLGELGAQTVVWRNDAGTVDDVRALRPDGVVVSPGPGHPRDARLSVDVVRELGPTLPVLGVCLGHQVIGHVYGGRVGAAQMKRRAEPDQASPDHDDRSRHG